MLFVRIWPQNAQCEGLVVDSRVDGLYNVDSLPPVHTSGFSAISDGVNKVISHCGS
jgi:hypothetical protein